MCRERVLISWKENTKTRAAVAERLGTPSGRALPKAVYVVLPVVISCEAHNVPAAGTGTSAWFGPQSPRSAASTRLHYEAGIKMTPWAAGAVLPLKSCVRPTNVFTC